MIQIKICGLTTIEDIDKVNGLLPNYIGFVFAKGRHEITPYIANHLKERLDVRIKAVGVFVNEPISSIVKLIDDGVIDVVQLHGDESEEYIIKLKEKTDCPIIKAIRVQTTEQILKAEKLPCDMLLLDSYKKGQYGGSGENFDCFLIPPNLKKPYFLAGGLKNENIEQMILNSNPFAVDISTGVETDGFKDENKMRQIIDIISNINKGKK